MKQLLVATLIGTSCLSGAATAGDAVNGANKAGACILCHGTQGFPGLFYTLQLAGRNADKLTVKTNKYRTGKIIHPIMNLVSMPLTEKDVEDISAFYQGLGKPIVIVPFLPIKGDDPEPEAGATAAK